jgi:hypothetical protein
VKGYVTQFQANPSDVVAREFPMEAWRAFLLANILHRICFG